MKEKISQIVEIVEITKIIPVKDHMIEITIYERKDQEGSDQKRNVMLFVHGGGFIGGDVKTKGNQCRYLAQQSGAVVCLTGISSGT